MVVARIITVYYTQVQDAWSESLFRLAFALFRCDVRHHFLLFPQLVTIREAQTKEAINIPS